MREKERGREKVDRVELYLQVSRLVRSGCKNDKSSPLQIILFLPCTQHEGIREEIKQIE